MLGGTCGAGGVGDTPMGRPTTTTGPARGWAAPAKAPPDIGTISPEQLLVRRGARRSPATPSLRGLCASEERRRRRRHRRPAATATAFGTMRSP